MTTRPTNGQSLPAPGIYEDVPEDVYHSWPLASASRLSRAAAYSWAHVKHDMERPPEPTPDMRRGTALHMAVLEPGRFAATYSAAGPCSATTSKGAPCSYSGSVRIDGDWYCGTHAKKASGDPEEIEVLPAGDAEDVAGMQHSLWAHPDLGSLLFVAGRRELTVVWDEEVESGPVRCKARLDLLVEHPALGLTLVDIKTTRDARPRAFENSLVDRGYCRQMAIYRRGLQTHGVDVDAVVFAAVEQSAPYAAVAYSLDDGQLELGWEDVPRLLSEWAECWVSGRWPSYPTGIQAARLPQWELRRRGYIDEENPLVIRHRD